MSASTIEAGAIPERLRDVLRAIGPMTVAFSGGVDSTFLAVAAAAVLGREHVRAITAVSASLAADDHDRCEALARTWDLRWEPVTTYELDDDRYTVNDADRCYWCKTHLMDAIGRIDDGTVVVLGVNLDDLADHRPGQRAAADRGARFPLVEAALDKTSIRAASKAIGLQTWDQPAAPCLASRLPYGTAVTLRRLSTVERAEASLRRLGFREVRVRHHDDVARIEIPSDELGTALNRRDDIVEAVRAAGYRYVALDLEGFASGRLNRALDEGATTTRPPEQ